MNKKTLIIIIISLAVILMISGVLLITVNHARSASSFETGAGAASPSPTADGNDDTYIPPTKENDVDNPVTSTQELFVPATEMDLDPSSITVFVNKEHTLPKDYRPKKLVIPDIYFDLTYFDERTMMRPEAAKAIQTLFAAAKKAGYDLSGVSGYRSYDRQYKIFINNIVTKGKDHTLKYSAVPGASEHQTGLAMDISSKSLDFDLSTEFADTPEGKWIAENAHLYGYIVRYAKGKSDITGYAYEPWHIRYVGRGLATYLYQNDLTLEEYYHYTPSANFDFEAQYAALINYMPTIAISAPPLEGDGVVIGENGEIIEGELGTEVEEEKDGEVSEEGTTETPTPAPEPTPETEDQQGDDTEGSDDITDTPDPTDPQDSDDTTEEPTELTPSPTDPAGVTSIPVNP